jgi:hypothetical protein
MRLAFGKTQRVEIGGEMAAHAVGTNQHQRADRIANGLKRLGRRQLDALGLRLVGNLLLDAALGGFLPIACQRRHQFAVDRHRPVGTLPGRALRVGEDVFLALLQAAEKGTPVSRDGAWVFLKAGIQILDIGGVRTVEEGGLFENVTEGWLFAHVPTRRLLGPRLPTLYRQRIWSAKGGPYNDCTSLRPRLYH